MRSIFVVLVLALASCATAPQQMRPVVSEVTTAPGVTLHVETYGNGSNVVIMPGRLFLPPLVALATPDRTLITYDMRNRGLSSRVEDGSVINIMEDVNDVEALRQHFGVEKFSLIGWSYLGLMTALYVSEHPDRVERLVQIGPVPRQWNAPYPAELRADASSLSPEGQAANAAWQSAAAAANADTDQNELCAIEHRAFSFLLVGNPENAVRVPNTCVYENELPRNQRRHLNFHFVDIRDRAFSASQFTGLLQPTLVIHGTLDRNAPYGGGREWARTFPDARLITVQGGAHDLWLDDPAIITEADRFLRGAWPTRAARITD